MAAAAATVAAGRHREIARAEELARAGGPALTRSRDDAPPLGRAWYCAAADGEEILQGCAALRTAALLARRHTKQLIADGGRIHRTSVLSHPAGRA